HDLERPLSGPRNHLPLVRLPVEGHAEQWVSEDVAVVRVEVEVVLPVGRRLALEADGDDALVVLPDRLLPLASESRRPGRRRQALDRASAALAGRDGPAADEAGGSVLEVVGVQIVDRDG